MSLIPVFYEFDGEMHAYYVNVCCPTRYPEVLDKYVLDERVATSLEVMWRFEPQLSALFYRKGNVCTMQDNPPPCYDTCRFVYGQGRLESGTFVLKPDLEKEFTRELYMKREGVFAKREFTETELRDLIVHKANGVVRHGERQPSVMFSRNGFGTSCLLSCRDGKAFEAEM